MMEQSIQYIPEVIGFASGYAIGLGIDQYAVKKAAVDKTPLIVDWALDSSDSVKLASTKREQASRLFRRVTPGVALGLGLMATTGVAAFVPIESNTFKPAAIEVVIDHSGATGLNIGGEAPVLPYINKLADSFTSSNTVNSEAFVASFNGVTETKVSNVSSLSVSGFAPLEAAVSNALEQTALIKNGNKSNGAAVVVLTNGNNIGNPQTIKSESLAQGKTPVYVVNVEGANTTSPQLVSEFKSIASETNAKYWSANETNTNEVVKEIENTLSPEHRSNKANPYQDFLLFISGVAGLSGFRAYRSRRQGLLQRNIEGK